MGNTQNRLIGPNEALAKAKPKQLSSETQVLPNSKVIKPLIFSKSKWRCLTPKDVTEIHKNKPKMLSTLQLTRLDFSKLGKQGLKALCKSFKDIKNLYCLIINSGDYNAKELLHILRGRANHLKVLKFHFNQADLNIDEELTQNFTKLKKFKDLQSLDISFDETENNKIKENITNYLSRQTRALPRLTDFTLSFSPIEGITMNIDMEYIPTFIFKYPKSLKSLTLKLNPPDHFLQQLLSQFTSQIQHLNQLEQLSLDFDIMSTDLEPQVWQTFFQKTQQLKSLCLQKSFTENNEQSEASKAFLQGFSQLKNLISLEISFIYLSGESQTQAFMNLLSNHLASCPDFKSLTLALSAPIFANNHPTGELPYFFPSIRILTQLEQLQLNFNCNRIDKIFMEGLAHSLENLHLLKSLKVSICNLESLPRTTLFPAECLLELINLTTLDLNFSNIDFDRASMDILLKSVAEYPLTSLRLILGQQKIKTVLQKIGSLWEDTQRLTHFFSTLYGSNQLTDLSLNLSGLDISIPEYKHFALALKELNKLTALSLVLPEFDSSNNFETFQYVLNSFAEMPKLTSLFMDFKGRGLGRKEIHHLAASFECCKSIENLELSFSYGSNFERNTLHCFFSGIATLSSSLKNLKLSLEGTPMFDRVRGYRSVVEELTALRNLEILIFHSVFRQYPRYPSQGILQDLKKSLVEHPNFKQMIRLEIGGRQII